MLMARKAYFPVLSFCSDRPIIRAMVAFRPTLTGATMSVQHVTRSASDRRKFDMSANAAIEKERRWNKDRRSLVVNEDELYDPDWEVGDSDLAEYARIALDD